jgi:hypothetical protein
VVAGPVATIDSPDELCTMVEGVKGPATLQFRLTATDTNGHTSATDDVIVTVRAPK